MRRARSNQRTFELSSIDHEYARELEEISRILEQAPGINLVYERVAKELSLESTSARGRSGLTAEQVVKVMVLRTRFGYNYRELEFVLQDSQTMSRFVGMEYQKPAKKTALCTNIRKVSEETWQALNECIKQQAQKDGIEDGQKVRGDTTTTETNIHYPTDASLLWDCIRVLCSILTTLIEHGVSFTFSNHCRRAKRQLYRINNTSGKKSKKSKKLHQESHLVLIRLARYTLSYAKKALEALGDDETRVSLSAAQLTAEKADLRHYIALTEKVIDQAYRRCVKKEKVPAKEKVVSIFEPHTYIIEKGGRDTVFGHKVALTSGKSSMILDLKVLEGNPADSTLVQKMIDDHIASYGYPPEQLVLDGGFSSKKNAALGNREGKEIEDLVFSKHNGIDLEDIVSALSVVKPLYRFRAGIEAIISNLKRGFGARRVLEKGLKAFKAVLQSTVVAYNLTLLARRRLQTAAT